MGFLLDLSLFISCIAIIVLGEGEFDDYITAGGFLLFGLVDLIKRIRYQSAIKRRIAKESALMEDK